MPPAESSAVNSSTVLPKRIKSSLFIKKLHKLIDFDILDVNVFPHVHIPFFRILYGQPHITTWHEVWNDDWRTGTNIIKLGKEIEYFNTKVGNEKIAVSKFTANSLSNLLKSKERGSLDPTHNISPIEG